MYVTIEYRDDKDRRKAHVIGIHGSPELAEKLIDSESPKKMEVLQWPNRNPPELGVTVAVADRQIVSDRPNGLLSLLEATLKRQDHADLRKDHDELHHDHAELRQDNDDLRQDHADLRQDNDDLREYHAELRQKNEVLGQYNSQLQNQLDAKQKSFHALLERDRTNSQFKDLWISATVQKARENMVADFARAEVPTLSKRIMLVPDSETAVHLNRLAQDNRTQQESFDASCGVAYNHVLLHCGDRVQFYRTDKELGVTDADLGEIIGLFPRQRTAVVALDRLDMKASELVFVPLCEYTDLDLGYATNYERAANLHPLYQAFLLADDSARQVVDALSARNVEIYADKLTAYSQFPELAGKQEMGQAIDMEADPLSLHRSRD